MMMYWRSAIYMIKPKQERKPSLEDRCENCNLQFLSLAAQRYAALMKHRAGWIHYLVEIYGISYRRDTLAVLSSSQLISLMKVRYPSYSKLVHEYTRVDMLAPETL